MKTNWINVKDKLPDTDREVLVAVKYTNIPIQAYYRNGVWIASFIKCTDHTSTDYEVTHWIELPKLIKSLQS